MPAARPPSLSEIVRQAIADLSLRGYVSREQIEGWLTLIRAAAEREIGSEIHLDLETRRHLEALYKKLVERGYVLKQVPEVGRYSLAMIRPDLRAELDRRILAAANLIKLHRKEAIEATLRRFEGWSTSIPPGGEGVIDKREIRAHVCKSARDFAWERRRVNIDQGAKLVNNIAEIVAKGNGAIAGIWHSRWREPNYNYRVDHKERDLKVYAVRGNWAIEQGLMNKGAGYIDEMTRPGEEVFCRCSMEFILSPRRLPDYMLTKKGQSWILESGGRSGTAAA